MAPRLLEKVRGCATRDSSAAPRARWARRGAGPRLLRDGEPALLADVHDVQHRRAQVRQRRDALRAQAARRRAPPGLLSGAPARACRVPQDAGTRMMQVNRHAAAALPHGKQAWPRGAGPSRARACISIVLRSSSGRSSRPGVSMTCQRRYLWSMCPTNSDLVVNAYGCTSTSAHVTSAPARAPVSACKRCDAGRAYLPPLRRKEHTLSRRTQAHAAGLAAPEALLRLT